MTRAIAEHPRFTRCLPCRLPGPKLKLILALMCSLFCLPPITANASTASEGAEIGEMAGFSSVSPLAAVDYGPFIARAVADEQAEATQRSSYPWRGAKPEQMDWDGITRDTAYFLGYQFVVIGVLYVLPESISGWDDETKAEYNLSKWVDNVTNPVVRDGDVWWVNYILHPYWGGTYYIRGRERGLDETQSFLYSTLLSTLYEYGAEALFEPVSIEDLIITPVVGSLVGEYLFTPLREYVRAKPGELSWSDKALLTLTDPLGVVNAATDRLFGVKTTLQFQPIGSPMPALSPGARDSAPIPAYLRKYEPAWGLQLRADW
mgnify:FL=1|jgi:hypothetical protein